MLPLTATKNFALLAEQYKAHPIEQPALKGVTLAQWAEESGWGQTKLAQVHGNYAGMVWGAVDENFGTPVMYGNRRFTQFTSLTNFIDCYWHRLDNVSVFNGWRDFADTPERFITYIAPGWLSGTPCGHPLTFAEKRYVRDVLDIRSRRTEEIFRNVHQEEA